MSQSELGKLALSDIGEILRRFDSILELCVSMRRFVCIISSLKISSYSESFSFDIQYEPYCMLNIPDRVLP